MRTVVDSVTRLFSAFNTKHLRDSLMTANLYVEMLEPFDADLIAEAVDVIIRTESFLPTIADVLDQARAIKRSRNESEASEKLRAMASEYGKGCANGRRPH